MMLTSFPVAYVGPGAGFAFFSTALLFIVSGAILLFAFLLVPFRWTRKLFQTLIPSNSIRYIVYALLILLLGWYSVSLVGDYFAGQKHPRMIVLGMDGLDPDIVRDMVDRGELPNFKRLIERGSISDLRVPNPPISPTSWASFITGSNPGRHGIMGFIGRNKQSYVPELFTTFKAAETFLNLPTSLNIPGDYSIPLFPDRPISKRQGKAFWKVTSNHGVNSTVVKVPVTFPPEAVNGKMLSGLGTPDLRGSQGSFSLWTEKTDEQISSGVVKRVSFVRNQTKSKIVGPENTLMDRPQKATTPIKFNRSDTGITISISRNDPFTLEHGEWSDWKLLEFHMGLGMSVTGVARFHLNSKSPFSLYMTPIQINPKDPVMAISHPKSYSNHLAKRVGFFYTMGMPQDDSALKSEVISDSTFVEQSYQGLRERRRILGLELRRERNGLLVGVFDTTDRIQHLFWRYRDPNHPQYSKEKAKKFSEVIPDVYRKMDEILGEIIDSVDDDVPIMIVSDHGFTSFRRQFHLNDWLHKNGYLSVQDSPVAEKGRFFRTRNGSFYVDWNRTKAYQMGLTGIYLNIDGREKNGTVSPSRKWEIAREIKRKLESVFDPKTKQHVFKNVYLSKNIYEGLFWQGGPDLILGYNDGYRTSWKSARGELHEGKLITDNMNKWSGDHIIDNSIVPGSLITSFPLGKNQARIEDVAATVYDFYGIEKPKIVDGHSFLPERETK